MEEMGEVVIQFGSLDELNGLIERLSPGATSLSVRASRSAKLLHN
jgi:hypothetical protein